MALGNLNTMDRREAMAKLGMGMAGIWLGSNLSWANHADGEARFKLGIRNGLVLADGLLQPLYVAVTPHGRIQLSQEPLPVQQEIDASGLLVSPGFIDILADNSSNPQGSYQIFERYKITDGVTTALQLHGGQERPSWFYRLFSGKQHYTNYGVAAKLMDIRNANTSLKARECALREALEGGALAVSHSLEYQPMPFEEIQRYAYWAASYNRPLCLHLRYSSKERELEGVQEAIRIARETGVRLHISHLHSTGGMYQMEQALAMIHQANIDGAQITACVYPYSYWATYLHSKRFDKGWQERYGLDYSDLTVVGTGERLTAKRFYELRQTFGVLVAVPEGAIPLNKTVDLALKTDFCMIASDGGIEREPQANSHPRGAGCFATSLRYMHSLGISWPDALKKLTELPAQLLQGPLQKRGLIANGHIADLTIFDPNSVDGRATVANPNQYSQGINWVIVNGKIAYTGNQPITGAGMPIAYGA